MDEGFYVQSRYPDHPVPSMRDEWTILAMGHGAMSEDEARDLRDACDESHPEVEYRVVELRVVE